jgi:hypothetical protein
MIYFSDQVEVYKTTYKALKDIQEEGRQVGLATGSAPQFSQVTEMGVGRPGGAGGGRRREAKGGSASCS